MTDLCGRKGGEPCLGVSWLRVHGGMTVFHELVEKWVTITDPPAIN
jgi:hypothetical protein